jgi:2-polyprenyl-3-methyl-5-hydroxy-6-metoxy-1,4-benzoquinol methylase
MGRRSMSIDRSRRITFEEVAELYDQVRPSYPEELVDDALALSGIPAGGQILEIGCGPGNATIPFARRGYRIVGIER